jgi:hypothetical protein
MHGMHEVTGSIPVGSTLLPKKPEAAPMKLEANLRGSLCASLVGLLALTVAGCCSDPWRAYPESAPPDHSCSTGSVQGSDVYIWDCLRGQRVVVAQYSAEMSCQAPERAVSACGTITSLEKSLALTPEKCKGPRPGREWR